MTLEPRYKVLLISKKNDSILELRDRLAEMKKYVLTYKETAESAMAFILSEKLQCIILNLEQFGHPQIKLLNDLRKVGDIQQFLVLAETADKAALEAVKEVKDLIVLEKAALSVDDDILGICERTIGKRELYFREQVRLPTNQRVTVEILETGRHYDGVMRDVTAKGACVELGTGNLKMGDKVKILIYLEKLHKQRTVTAEVKWSKTAPGRGIIGLLFLTPMKDEESKK